jgi:hypothetical protein
MPDVAFKDLCIDVTAGRGRPGAVAKFWGAALHQPVVEHEGGDFHLEPPMGGSKERTIWINSVIEPIAGKSRVHLDLRVPGGDPVPLISVGARIVREPGPDHPWYVLNDPDGVALCVFPPLPEHPDAISGPFELVVDAVDPERIARWWADRTGGRVGRRPGADFAWVEGAAGFPFQYWVFNPVPEPKTVKNRVHWDVKLADASVDDLVDAGASLLRTRDGEIDWWVMADPEGNEFCAFQ